MARVEPRLRRALVATYGPVDGRQATVDALTWAWKHWERLETVTDPGAYLYRVGQSAVRRFAGRPIPLEPTRSYDEIPGAEPELLAAVSQLPTQQRAAVLLVHGFGWTQREAASMLGIAPSTLQVHVQRALDRLRQILEVKDAC